MIIEVCVVSECFPPCFQRVRQTHLLAVTETPLPAVVHKGNSDPLQRCELTRIKLTLQPRPTFLVVDHSQPASDCVEVCSVAVLLELPAFLPEVSGEEEEGGREMECSERW